MDIVLKELGSMVVKSSFPPVHICLLDKIDPLTDENQRQRRIANVENFYRHSGDYLYYKISDNTATQLRQVKSEDKIGKTSERVRQDFREIRKKLYDVRYCFDKIDSQSSLAKYCNRTIQHNDPIKQATILYEWIKGSRNCPMCSAGGQALCDDLIIFCDIPSYEQWQEDIKNTFIEAFGLVIIPLAEQSKATVDKVENPALQQRIEELQLKLRLWTKETKSILSAKFRELKIKLILKAEAYQLSNYPKDYPKLNELKDPSDPCGLGLYLETFLRDIGAKQGQKVAKDIHSVLITLHRHLVWSVVVLPDYQSTDFVINPDNIKDVYSRKFGLKLDKSLSETALSMLTFCPDHGVKRVDIIANESMGPFGCLLCFRRRDNIFGINGRCRQSAIIVLWADPESVTVDVDSHNACADLQQGDEEINMLSLTNKLEERGLDWVFTASIDVSKGFANTIGISLGLINDQSFPVQIGKGNCFALTWPKKKQHSMPFPESSEKTPQTVAIVPTLPSAAPPEDMDSETSRCIVPQLKFNTEPLDALQLSELFSPHVCHVQEIPSSILIGNPVSTLCLGDYYSEMRNTLLKILQLNIKMPLFVILNGNPNVDSLLDGVCDTVAVLIFMFSHNWNSQCLTNLYLPNLVEIRFVASEDICLQKGHWHACPNLRIISLQLSSIKEMEDNFLVELSQLVHFGIFNRPLSASQVESYARINSSAEYEWFQHHIRAHPSLIQDRAQGEVYKINHEGPNESVTNTELELSAMLTILQERRENLQTNPIFGMEKFTKDEICKVLDVEMGYERGASKFSFGAGVLSIGTGLWMIEFSKDMRKSILEQSLTKLIALNKDHPLEIKIFLPHGYTAYECIDLISTILRDQVLVMTITCAIQSELDIEALDYFLRKFKFPNLLEIRIEIMQCPSYLVLQKGCLTGFPKLRVFSTLSDEMYSLQLEHNIFSDMMELRSVVFTGKHYSETHRQHAGTAVLREYFQEHPHYLEAKLDGEDWDLYANGYHYTSTPHKSEKEIVQFFIGR